MKQLYFDAHFHWFGESQLGEKLANNIGDKPSSEYFLSTYYDNGGLIGGIVMGNGDINQQGVGIPENFYYCMGLDNVEQLSDIEMILPKIEYHLQQHKCVGVKLYPGYIPLYPNSKNYEAIISLLIKYNKVLSVHTGMLAGMNGKLKYAHPMHVDDIAVDYPELRIVMCHFGNPFLADATAVIEHNSNVYADLSGLIEGRFETAKFIKDEKLYVELLKT